MTYKKHLNCGRFFFFNQRRRSKNTALSPSPKILYSVAHAIPGRIRFRVPRIKNDTEYANKLKLVIESDPRTKDVRVNPTAESIVINYQTEQIADEQMQEHLVNLIQNAPDIVLPKPVTAKSVVGVIFDAAINLIDSMRNVNKARNAIVHHRYRKDIWERMLSGAKNTMKGLKSAILFLLPGRRSPSLPGDVSLQPKAV